MKDEILARLTRSEIEYQHYARLIRNLIAQARTAGASHDEISQALGQGRVQLAEREPRAVQQVTKENGR